MELGTRKFIEKYLIVVWALQKDNGGGIENRDLFRQAATLPVFQLLQFLGSGIPDGDKFDRFANFAPGKRT